MNFDDIDYHAKCFALENMLVHIANMLDDCESFADPDDRK